MVGAISGSGSSNPYMAQLLKRIDSNGDGSISQAEFVAGRPKGATEAQATSLFSKLDSSGKGAVGIDALSQQMSDLMHAALTQIQGGQAGQGGEGGEGGHHGVHGAPGSGGGRATQLFSKLDSNGDGTVTQAEFMAVKPASMTDTQATDLWSQLGGTSTNGLTKDQLVSGIKSIRASESSSSAAVASTGSATAGDHTALDKLLKTLTASSTDAAGPASGNDALDKLIKKLTEAISAYNASSGLAGNQNAGTTTSIAA